MNGPIAELFEIQPPARGRKCSPADPRPLDPPPMLKLVLPRGRHGLDYTALFCHAELFRMPDRLYPGYYTYFSETGDHDASGLPIYALQRTQYNPGLPIYGSVGDMNSGQHLLTSVSVETHLLVRRTPEPARTHPTSGDIIFMFAELGVQQVGTYRLHYTVYEENNAKVATCLGQPFVVSPAAQAAPLAPSTELTKSLGPLRIPALRLRG